MEIIEYSKEYEEDFKNLLKELQEYIISLDPYHFNVIDEDYKDKIYEKEINDVNNNNGKIYLAKESNKIIGAIVGIIEPEKHEFDYNKPCNTGNVLELIVSNKIRSRGVGHKLLKTMEDYFESMDCYNINIDVFGYNLIGRNFYKKNEYHERMLTVSKKIK